MVVAEPLSCGKVLVAVEPVVPEVEVAVVWPAPADVEELEVAVDTVDAVEEAVPESVVVPVLATVLVAVVVEVPPSRLVVGLGVGVMLIMTSGVGVGVAFRAGVEEAEQAPITLFQSPFLIVMHQTEPVV